jgi:putative membrane protein
MPFRDQGPNMGWGRGFFALLLILIAVCIIVWIVTALVRPGGHVHRHELSPGANPPSNGSSDALRILDERFARGDIDADEYTKRKELLRSSP